MERFNLRKLSEIEIRELYQIRISNKSAGLENLNDSKNMNKTRKNIKDTRYIKSSATESLVLYELKQHKNGFIKHVHDFFIK